MLFSKAIELFIKNAELLGRSQNTIKHYFYYLNKFSKYLTEKYNRALYINEIKTNDLEGYLLNELAEEVYSSSARHNLITAFKSLYNYCHIKGYCSVNTGRLIRNVKVETKERDYITELEFAKMIRQIKSPTAYAVVYTLFYTGLRISECIKLTIDDIDFDNGIIMVKEGKGKKDRNIPMHKNLQKVLMNYIIEERYYAGTDNFFSSKSGKITKQYVNRVLNRAVIEASINKKVSCHVLRHSFISNLVHKGAGLLRVQKLAGHKSIKTVKTYLHTSFEELQNAVNLL